MSWKRRMTTDERMCCSGLPPLDVPCIFRFRAPTPIWFASSRFMSLTLAEWYNYVERR